MKTRLLTQALSFTLLPLLFLSITTAQQIPLSHYLPPFLAGYQDQTCFLSGFGQSFGYDISSNTLYPIIQDLETACSISSNDIPFNSRLFVDDIAGSYYYCPRNQSLLVLDASQNFTVTGNYINLASSPVFNEVKMKTFSFHQGILVLLGLVNAPNTLDTAAKNYTESYMITISWEIDKVVGVQQLTGAHEEPIVDVEALADNNIVVTGEKVYSCGEKMNTYYMGKWGDSSFNSVVDFYIANSFGFVPQIKGSADGRYLVYTNYQSIFVYCTRSLAITQSFDVTLVANNYSVNGETIMHWESIPFVLTSQGKDTYVFYQGNLNKYTIPDINNKDDGGSIPIQIPASNATYSRFFFYGDQNQENALIQMGNSAFVFSLSDSENQFENFRTRF